MRASNLILIGIRDSCQTLNNEFDELITLFYKITVAEIVIFVTFTKSLGRRSSRACFEENYKSYTLLKK